MPGIGNGCGGASGTTPPVSPRHHRPAREEGTVTSLTSPSATALGAPAPEIPSRPFLWTHIGHNLVHGPGWSKHETAPLWGHSASTALVGTKQREEWLGLPALFVCDRAVYKDHERKQHEEPATGEPPKRP